MRPADLAVLVNKRKEADLIRGALARRGVRSVYLSDQDSVFLSPQARELQHWLAACAEPDDTRLVRTALATRTLGLSWAELDQLNQDELALEGRVLQFRGYRDLWRRQGVLPMLRGLINDFRVPARLLGLGAMSESEVPAPRGPTPWPLPPGCPDRKNPGRRRWPRTWRSRASGSSPTCYTWPNCCNRPADCSMASMPSCAIWRRSARRLGRARAATRARSAWRRTLTWCGW